MSSHSDVSGVGRVWKFGDNIDTDLMQPGHALVGNIEEEARYVFEANRPGWVDLVHPGDVIVAGRNFGTGSSRPASRALRRAGVGAVLAESINGLFFRNCVNYALPALECKGVQALFEEGDVASFDLRSGEIRNTTREGSLHADPWPSELLDVLEAGGLVALLHREGLVLEGEEQR
jgi:3-isopropylmalate/(R)-2-methylmalate dehydratase small subunit